MRIHFVCLLFLFGFLSCQSNNTKYNLDKLNFVLQKAITVQEGLYWQTYDKKLYKWNKNDSINHFRLFSMLQTIETIKDSISIITKNNNQSLLKKVKLVLNDIDRFFLFKIDKNEIVVIEKKLQNDDKIFIMTFLNNLKYKLIEYFQEKLNINKETLEGHHRLRRFLVINNDFNLFLKKGQEYEWKIDSYREYISTNYISITINDKYFPIGMPQGIPFFYIIPDSAGLKEMKFKIKLKHRQKDTTYIIKQKYYVTN